jgi:hypothetical protein
LDCLKFPAEISPSLSSPSQFAGLQLQNAVGSIMTSFSLSIGLHKREIASNARLYHGLKAALHNYATDSNLALAFGDVAEEIFEAARAEVDSFVRANCPKAAEQLLAVYERLRAGNAEDLAQAMASCRRVLCTVADTVFPPRPEPYVDRRRKSHKVGSEDYKNRLLAYFDHTTESDSSLTLLEGDMAHLSARLDAIYSKSSKGVHADVSIEEARLALIHTYLLLAEVARASATRR